MIDTWRVIDTGPCRASYNMALDEAIAATVKKANSPPTLRLYEWDIPSVSIGYFQRMRGINVDYCQERGIPIVRRPTGGRAILHSHEVTYSFSVQTEHGIFSKGLLDSYKKISRALGLALSKVGLSPDLKLIRENRHSSDALHRRNPLCLQSISYGEIMVNNKKVIGSAQRRWTDGLLQQGSIPFIIDKDEIAKVFRLESPDIGDKIIGLKEILLHLSLDDLRNAIRVSFEETFSIRLIPSSPSQDEVSLAREFEVKKYLAPLWNFQR
jgi:lipoate-protein ligase A